MGSLDGYVERFRSQPDDTALLLFVRSFIREFYVCRSPPTSVHSYIRNAKINNLFQIFSKRYFSTRENRFGRRFFFFAAKYTRYWNRGQGIRLRWYRGLESWTTRVSSVPSGKEVVCSFWRFSLFSSYSRATFPVIFQLGPRLAKMQQASTNKPGESCGTCALVASPRVVPYMKAR